MNLMRSVSIRTGLLASLLLVILLLTGGILATTILGARHVVQTLSRSLLDQRLDEMEVRLKGFFEPAAKVIRMAKSWGDSGRLDIDQTFASIPPDSQEDYPLLPTPHLVPRELPHSLLVRTFRRRWRLMEFDGVTNSCVTATKNTKIHKKETAFRAAMGPVFVTFRAFCGKS